MSFARCDISLQRPTFGVEAKFSIPDRGVLGIFGPSGSGKSLLLRVLADLDPHDGDVLFDEKSINDYKPCEWRKKVALLPSESQWWFDSVGEHFHKHDFDIFHYFLKQGLGIRRI